MAEAKDETAGVLITVTDAVPGINSLPDDLLLKVFCHVPERNRRALPQICHRWARVADGGSELWTHRDVVLCGKPYEDAEQNWVRMVQWHHARAQAITSLAVRASGEGLHCLGPLLGCLCGNGSTLCQLEVRLMDSAWRLRSGALLGLQVASMAAMSCFQHLKKLVLKNWPGGISPALSDCIKSLTKLEHLEISLGKDRSWDRTSTWEDDALYSDSDEEPSEDEEGPEFLSSLSVGFNAALRKLRLHTLVLQGGWPGVPANIVHMASLRRLVICTQGSMHGFPEGTSVLTNLTSLAVLNREGARNRSVLDNLANMSSLRELRVMDRAFPTAVGTLTGLTSLEMRIGRMPHARVEEDFRLMLRDLTNLSKLHLEVHHLEMLPDALVRLDYLKDLRLERCTLAGLPRGPYLTSLQALSLIGNSLDRLPASLAGASDLLRLDLSENEGLTLGKSGKKILMHMSALTQIRACAAPHMDAAAPLRLADELFKVASARQQQWPSQPLEIQVSRNDPHHSEDGEDTDGSDTVGPSDSDSDSDVF